MRNSVPSARYSSVCNVLRQWKTSLILTYRVYRLYDSYSYSSPAYSDSVLSSDARLHVNPIDVQCANGFSVTRPSLNRSFTIRHTVSLPLRRHSRTQSQLATSVKRNRYLARGSLGSRRRRRTFEVLNYGYNLIIIFAGSRFF